MKKWLCKLSGHSGKCRWKLKERNEVTWEDTFVRYCQDCDVELSDQIMVRPIPYQREIETADAYEGGPF